MKWNQQTIHNWGIETFGDAAKNALGVAIRMSKEAIELSNVLMVSDEHEKIYMESADVAIVLVQVASCIGFDVHAEERITSEMSQEVELEIDTEIDVAEILNTASIDLISAIFHDAPKEQIVLQLMKILICLGFLEDMYGFDLLQKIQEKMEINFARQWAKKEDGSYQHVSS